MFLVALLVLLMTVIYLQTRKPKGFPPGPPRYPFIGNGPFLENRLVHKTLLDLSSTYGPVIGLYLGNHPTVIVNGWEAIKESLSNDDLNGRPETFAIKYRDSGDIKGVMFTNGNLWKEQRRFSLHHFRNLGFGKRSHEAVIHEEITELIKEIEDVDEGVELQVKLGVSAINILWAIMGGTRFHRKDPRLEHLVVKLNTTFQASVLGGAALVIIPIFRHFMSTNSLYGRVTEGFRSVIKFIQVAVEEHKATLDEDNPRDFIDIYLIETMKHKNDKDTTFTEPQLISLCTDIFSAGTETTSSSVSFAILLSAFYPAVMKKLHEELDNVVGQERLPSIDDRPQLVYTEAFLTEVSRFRGSAPFTVPHCAIKDTKLQGYPIPARTRVINNLYSISVDKKYWGDPENFRPERFLNPDGTFRRDERMIPFGKGRRICLGESLARMTQFLMFTALIQKFSFKIDPSLPFEDTEGTAGLTLAPPKFKVFAKSRF